MTGRDLSRIIEELRQQQRQALDAALREKIDHHDGHYLGLSGGALQLIGALESSIAALERMQREGEA